MGDLEGDEELAVAIQLSLAQHDSDLQVRAEKEIAAVAATEAALNAAEEAAAAAAAAAEQRRRRRIESKIARAARKRQSERPPSVPTVSSAVPEPTETHSVPTQTPADPATAPAEPTEAHAVPKETPAEPAVPIIPVAVMPVESTLRPATLRGLLDYTVGDRVRLCQLEQQPHHNGRAGTVIGLQRERVLIVCDPTADDGHMVHTFAVRPTSLEFFRAPMPLFDTFVWPTTVCIDLPEVPPLAA